MILALTYIVMHSAYSVPVGIIPYIWASCKIIKTTCTTCTIIDRHDEVIYVTTQYLHLVYLTQMPADLTMFKLMWTCPYLAGHYTFTFHTLHLCHNDGGGKGPEA